MGSASSHFYRDERMRESEVKEAPPARHPHFVLPQRHRKAAVSHRLDEPDLENALGGPEAWVAQIEQTPERSRSCMSPTTNLLEAPSQPSHGRQTPNER